ncbi:LysR family transcriptional regulator [Pseudooceanicola sp. CBS1P-1]|uniref:LysR family transcriptional regulator n=1 Tax=Pseudooceanicola albus TaxID=2692189 RepID=A0A6L7G5L6_9RHOB|nr:MULTISPECIES: LysR family transcriptional regulator [Pseudooceanicola]MBT9386846.1 LysR family transcriptional regulator [Pseudooceanicola endophyticus]MXN19331.1 LysR family transcriptional regulator [Pseudooceanicola albus]
MDDLRTMRLFVAIAEAGSLSAVARTWGVAPSTVTLGLQRLEERLGTQLVLRSTRQLSLTHDGELFLNRCRMLLGSVDELMSGFSDEGPLTGEIRMTATNDFGRRRISPLIGDFLALHPGVTVQLYFSDAMVDLVEGGFDIGIRTGPLPDSDLRARLLMRGRKCVCAAPAYWDRHGRPRHPKELADHACLVLGTPSAYQSFWNFRDGSSPLRVRVAGNRRVNDGETLRRWAVAGAGVIMKSSFDIDEELANGQLETVLDDYLSDSTNIYAVTPIRSHDVRRVRMLVDFLGENLA